MKIVSDKLSLDELKLLAGRLFGNMVKAVVDIEREIIALDAELHSDLESLLLKEGSLQDNIWGINFYPDLPGEDFVEFDSLINIRPSRGNSSRGVQDPRIQEKILNIVNKRILR